MEAVSSGNHGNRVRADCKVTPWSTWSMCSATCGRGFQYKRRTIVVQALHPGVPHNCSVKLEHKKRCDLPKCREYLCSVHPICTSTLSAPGAIPPTCAPTPTPCALGTCPVCCKHTIATCALATHADLCHTNVIAIYT